MLDRFYGHDYSPMLIGHEVEPFNHDNYLFELKFDGIRALLYLDQNKVVIKNKRNKDVTDIYPELSQLYKNTNKKCILDGEIVVFKNGKPNFFEIQKRSLMTDQNKILIAMKTSPVQVVVFDILYYDGEDLTDLPLIKRKEYLTKYIKENQYLSISRYIEKNGIPFFQLACKNGLEGIVGKRIDSLYFEGTRTKDWKKIKNMKDEDVIICGYEVEGDNIKNYILASYRDNNLIYRGKVFLGISNEEKKYVKQFVTNHKGEKYFTLTSQNIIWLEPILVGTVHYMELTKNYHFRQPVWKGIRNDKTASDCVIKE